MFLSFFLFSGGQDSCTFYWFYLLEKNKTTLSLISFQHKVQINNFINFSHFIFLAISHQQVSVVGYLFNNTSTIEFKNEKTLRVARYQSTSRIKIFYQTFILFTAHNKSDFAETLFLKLIRTNQKVLFPLLFEKKILLDFLYHRQLLKLVFFQLIKTRETVKKKEKRYFFLKTAINKKKVSFFSRPLINFSRVSLEKICLNYKVPVFIDITNFSFLLTRNKVRRHLLVYIEYFLLKTFYKSSKNPSSSFFKQFFYKYYFYFFKQKGFGLYLFESYYFFKTKKEKTFLFLLLWSFLLASKNKNSALIYKKRFIFSNTKKIFFFLA